MFVRNQIDRQRFQEIERNRYWKEGNWSGGLGLLSPLLMTLTDVFVAARNLVIQVLRSEIFYPQLPKKKGQATVEKTEVQ